MTVNFGNFKKFLPGVILGLIFIFAFAFGVGTMSGTTKTAAGSPTVQQVTTGTSAGVIAPTSTDNSAAVAPASNPANEVVQVIPEVTVDAVTTAPPAASQPAYQKNEKEHEHAKGEQHKEDDDD